MEVECPRHPGASAIGSQLQDETGPILWLANPCSPAMSPCAEGKKGTCHTDVINTEETRKSRGRSNLETMLAPRTVLQQM